MPRKPAPNPVKRVVVRPEIKKCPNCKSRLVIRREKYRVVWTFKRPVLERTVFLHCQNPSCEMFGVEVRPTRRLAPPRFNIQQGGYRQDYYYA